MGRFRDKWLPVHPPSRQQMVIRTRNQQLLFIALFMLLNHFFDLIFDSIIVTRVGR